MNEIEKDTNSDCVQLPKNKVKHNEIDQLKDICFDKLKELNLEKYEKRLNEELKEIDAQDCASYFLSIKEKKKNENNLLVPYLLGICGDVDLDKDPVYDYGDFPDLDIDMLPEVRDYLMNEYTRKEFGEKHVCNIVTYQTYKLKSTLLDIVRLFSLDRKEALAITSKIKDKDKDGKDMTLDEALTVYEDLKEYFDKYPEVATAVRKIMSRTKSMGQHASGVIISGVPIDQYVPLVKVPGSDQPCSSWGEGLKTTDLGPVGFVKFDFLSLKANMKIALATHWVEKLYGCKVSALPGQGHWTDSNYLNDPKSLEMARKGDLGMVFQFDASDGIRRLARQCGIDRFEDICAVASLFRPGTMKMNVHEIYCDRKNGKEKFEYHPLTKSFMDSTYDLLIYQEQVMKILNVVGKIPLKDCEIVRKAISKKKVELFKKYQEMFVENGQITLGWDKEKVEQLWKTIEAFSLYSFNLCLSGNTMLHDKVENKYVSVEDACKNKKHRILDSYVEGKIIEDEVVDVFETGEKEVYEINLDNEMKINCTKNHKFLCSDQKMHTVEEIFAKGLEILCWDTI